MSIEKVNVQITADGGEAVGTIRKVQREMDKLERDAKQVQQEVSQARGGSRNLDSRIDTLLSRAKSNGLLRGNVAEVAKAHVAATRLGGAAAIGYIAAIGLGRAGERGSHVLELIEEFDGNIGAGMKQAAREAVADAIGRNPINGAGRFVYQAYRKLRGFNATASGEVFDTALDLATSGISGNVSDVDAAIAAQAANRRAFLQAFDQQQAREARERQRRLEDRERAFQKIDETVSARLAGLQPVSFPTKLTPALQRRIEQEQELRERLRGTVQKVRLGAGVGA